MFTSEGSIEEKQLHDINMRDSETRSTTGDGYLAESLLVERKPRYKNIMHLWEFLLELLADESCRSLITWSRQAYGEFKLKNQEEVANRWGMFKCRPNMNYEKLSRALRHYYKQGIIKKVPGQRLVYRFHKLPYEYTPGRTLSESNLPTSPTRTIREDGQFFFQGSSACGVRRTADDSERTLTNKERMRRLLQERATMTRNLDKPTDAEQNEEERREVSSPRDSLEFPSVPSLLPYGRPIMSTPVRPVIQCCYGCSLQNVKPRMYCPTQLMYPVSAYENCSSYGWDFFQINPVPVSVLTSRYYQ